MSMSEKQCHYCDKGFTLKKNLLRHIKNVHDVNDPAEKPMQCPNCDSTFNNRKEVRAHLQSFHHIKQELEKLEFSNFEEFLVWKEDVEKTNFDVYVKTTGEYKCQKGRRNLFHCHRSGCFKSKSTGKKHLKSQGSNKIGKLCPATLEVLTSADGKVYVTHWKTHIDHDSEIGRTLLPKSDKKAIESKISSGIPFRIIMDSVRVEQNQFNRTSLLEHRDLWNIKRFVDNSSSSTHTNDVVSVNLYVNQLKCLEPSPLIYYKRQGVPDEKNILEEQDLCIVIMTEFQKDMMKEFGQDKICIDSTHGTNKYDYQLVTLLTIDEYCAGCPIAYCITNRIDRVAIGLFFSLIKEIIGPLPCKIFMSDDAPAFFNAWISVMPLPAHRLLCAWHVHKNLKENLCKIRNMDKRKYVEEALENLLKEANADTFEKNLMDFLQYLASNSELVDYYLYFNRHYVLRKTEWAACYRVRLGLNTNMHLEAYHKTLKYCYLNGKKNRRLDVCLRSLLKLSRNTIFDRMVKIAKNKRPACHKAINKSHVRAQFYDQQKILCTNVGKYQVISETKDDVIYTVEKEDVENCGCLFICSKCNVCIHMYSCECNDYLVRCNICKHIHACIMFSNECLTSPDKVNTGSLLENNVLNDVEGLFAVASTQTTEKNKEIEGLATTIVHLSQNCSVLNEKEHGDISYHLRKAISILEKNIPSGEGKDQPANENVHRQRKFLSTKKKRQLLHNTAQVNSRQITEHSSTAFDASDKLDDVDDPMHIF